MKTKAFGNLADELRKASEVALFSHVSPDGDCLGSMLAIGLALEQMGKRVEFYNPDPVPQNLTFLPGAARIKPWRTGMLLPSVLLFVDCADLQRADIPSGEIPNQAVCLNLDHHISNQNFGQVNWVDPEAAASGELAYDLILSLGVQLNLEMAENLYTAVLTDTGSFQYGNTTARTHGVAAALLELGIDFVRIHHQIFDQKPLAQVRLLEKALSSLELFADGNLGMMVLSLTDFSSSGAEDSLSEGLVNHARSIERVEAAALLREVGTGKVKVSLRSNLWLDVNAIASQFGGGGHKRAAGCTLPASLAEAKAKILAAMEEALRVGRNH